MALLTTRVVPEIDGNPTYAEISLRWVDAVGDLRADVSKVDGKATDAQIEALVVRLIQGSYASLYTVRVTKVYAGIKSKDNALALPYLSAQDNIVFHAKNAGREHRRVFLPSPKMELFVAGTDTPNPANGVVLNWMAKWDALWAGTFSGVSLRFSQRSDINKKVPL